MKKFKNIDMPGTEAIAVEEYHKIYFYTINMGRFMPGGLKAYAKQEIFFAPIKREQFLSILNAKKKQIKKYLREDFLHYW